jgi:ABC-type antimicrobial peptide transport system permease subunit
MERIENSPGIESVATMSVSPLSGAITSSQVATRDKGGAMETREIWPEHVSANYFPTIGTRIIQGRGFNDGDLTDNPVCVISVGAAAMLFSRQAALGQLVYQGRGKEAGVGSSSSVYCQVIGVAQDAHFKSMSAPADAVVYTLIKGVMPNLVVRAATTGLAIQAIQGAAQAVDLAALAGPIETIHARVGDDLRLFRVVTLAGEFCAGIAAIILGVGVFGILALQVAERRREIGVLMALGAGRRDVCWWVARKMRRSATIGLILGSVTALLAVKQFSGLFHQNWLYQVVVYLGALLLLGLLLLTAAFVPLRRALAVSPMECLSCE